MLRHFILLLILSVVAILFLHEVHQVLNVLVYAFNKISGYLSFIFAGDRIGLITRHVIALIILPVLIGLIVNVIYWAFTRRTIPGLFAIIWAVWLLLIALLG